MQDSIWSRAEAEAEVEVEAGYLKYDLFNK